MMSCAKDYGRGKERGVVLPMVAAYLSLFLAAEAASSLINRLQDYLYTDE